MSSDPHQNPRRDDVDAPKDATGRIDPASPGPVPGPAEQDLQRQSGADADAGETSDPQGQSSQGQYGQDQYGQGQYNEGQYGQSQYKHGQYGQDQYGQAADQHGQAGQSPYNQDPSYGGYGSGAAFARPAQQQPRAKRTVGIGGLALAVLLAGLLGGGVVAGTQALLDDGGVGTTTGGIEINTPESATVVTAAAARAAPSVVTLAVSEAGQGGSGSGIILDDQGYVLTNTHVVTLGGAAADPDIQVRMDDGSVSDAELVGTDPLSDLAVIRLQDIDGIQPAELGSSGELNVGDQAIAIGAPLGLAGTVTDGIVSTLNRTISVASSAVEDEGADAPEAPEEDGFEFYFPDMEGSPTQGSIHLNVIQTDAAINRGNSGGALVDGEGRVIGVNVAIASSGGAAETDAGSIGVGFAVPIDYAQRVAQELIDTGEVSHGLLGVTVAAAGSQEVPEEAEPGLAPVMPGFTVGALIDDVPDNTPAADAGLSTGDIITAVNDRRIEDSLALTATIREYPAGETVTITYLRAGQQEETEVTLGAT